MSSLHPLYFSLFWITYSTFHHLLSNKTLYELHCQWLGFGGGGCIVGFFFISFGSLDQQTHTKSYSPMRHRREGASELNSGLNYELTTLTLESNDQIPLTLKHNTLDFQEI